MTVSVLRLLTTVAGGLSGSEIARRLRAHQSTTRKVLERLVTRGIVSRTDIGRSAAYELNMKREIVTQIIVPLFRAEADLRVKLWTDLVAAVSRLATRPVAVVLYGSVARGAPAPRDLDLLIVARSAADKEKLRESMAEAAEDFAARYQLSISPLILTQAELKTRATEGLMKSVLKEGVFLFGEPVGPLRRMRSWHRIPTLESA